jgi:hypothetical protein
MKNNKKFSELIIDLTELWWEYNKSYQIMRDTTQSISERKVSGDYCESLIKKEYEIIDNLDLFFKKKLK